MPPGLEIHWEALARWLMWPTSPTFWFLCETLARIFGLGVGAVLWPLRVALIAATALFSFGQIERFPDVRDGLIEAGVLREARFTIATAEGRRVTVSDLWNDERSNFAGRVGIEQDRPTAPSADVAPAPPPEPPVSQRRRQLEGIGAGTSRAPARGDAPFEPRTPGG